MLTKKKIKVGVIFGGRSYEHEVSIVSAQSVIKALDKNKFEVIPIGISQTGKWLAANNAIKLFKQGKLSDLPEKILTPDPNQKSLVEINSRKLIKSSIKKLDVIFPILHGSYGEDGTIQGLLEMANLPYVGAGVLASAVGMDKIIMKKLFKQIGLPVVNFVYFLRKDWKRNNQSIIKKVEKELDYPIFVKPANSGSSVGINKAKNQKELIHFINEACLYDRKIIVEQGIEKVRELEIAVLGNDYPITSCVGEILSCHEFYDYEAKYVAGRTKTVAPAKIPDKLAIDIKKLAIRAFKLIDCAGMARVDFLYDNETKKLYLSELNTIPGFTSISMYPKLWAKSGLPYEKLLTKLINLAIARHQDKNQSLTTYKQKSNWYQK